MYGWMGRLVLVLAVVGGIAWYGVGHARAKEAEQKLAAIASEIAQRPVAVHCQSFGGELIDVSPESGRVKFDELGRPGDKADLKRKVCKALERFPKDRLSSGFACMTQRTPCSKRVHEDVWAMHVLAHEAWHLAGEETEYVAECKAVQTTALVALRLGADAAQAKAIGEYAWSAVYPQTPPAYQSPHCFNGSRLDLRPGDYRWP
jgi:hypothetical protein